MPNTYTTNLNLTLPQVGGDTDAWGTDLNNDLTTLDGIFASNGTGTSIGLNVGSGKTLAVGGVLSVTGSSSFSSPISVSSGGSGTSTAFTAGSVVFAGASGVYSQNNGQLFWDSTNSRLGIGTSSPSTKFSVVGAQNAPSGASAVGIGRFQESSGGNCVEIGYNYVSGVSAYGWIQSHDSAGASAYYALALNPLGGNVGIGTSSPTQLLDVNGNIKSSNYYIGTQSTGDSGIFGFSNSNGSGVTVSGSATANAGSLLFSTAGSERMRIDSSGNVGIGTGSPASKLDIVATANNAVARIISTDSTRCDLRFQTSGSISGLFFGNSTTFDSGRLYYENTNSAMVFYTNSSERMRINSSGNVGIGTSSPNSPLHVNGSANLTNQTYAYFALSGTSASTGYASGQTINVSIYASDRVSATEFDARSDGRLKNVIAEIPAADALKFIQDVKPVHYRWKDPASGGDKFGFIAQDVIKAGFANLIGQYPNENLEEETDADGFVSPKGIALTVNYDQVIPILSAAIKELAAEVAALKAKVGA